MYDVYHWEAHPDNSHPEPTTLAERITHYEDYLSYFPIVVWPGLVEEPITNPLSEMFGLFQDYWGDQTYLVVIDAQGKLAYQNSFPAGIMNITSIYDDIDALLPSIVPQTSINQKLSRKVSEIDIVKHGNSITFNFSATLKSEISIHTVSGKKVYSELISGNTLNINTESLATGNYLVKIKTSEGILRRNFLID